MAYKYSFADNEIYSADELNAITKRLVTSGIEDSFEDGEPYNVSKFNEQGSLLYTSGVVPETCLTLKVVSDGEEKILINPGKAFFDDGAVIEIEAGGEALSFTKGAKNFVYLKNDLLNQNICFPACTVEEPSGDYVMLAEIDENGVISDKRIYAKGKLAGYRSLTGEMMNIKDKVPVYFSSPTSGFGTKTIDIGNNSFHYILSISWPNSKEYGSMGIYDIENDRYMSCRAEETFGTLAPGILYIDRIAVHSIDNGLVHDEIQLSLADGKLTVKYEMYSGYAGRFEQGTTQDKDINFILF